MFEFKIEGNTILATKYKSFLKELFSFKNNLVLKHFKINESAFEENNEKFSTQLSTIFRSMYFLSI